MTPPEYPPIPHPPANNRGFILAVASFVAVTTWLGPLILASWLLSGLAASFVTGKVLTSMRAIHADAFDAGLGFAFVLVATVLLAAAFIAMADFVNRESLTEQAKKPRGFWTYAWLRFFSVSLLAIGIGFIADKFDVLTWLEPIGWLSGWFWACLVLPLWLIHLWIRGISWAWQLGGDSRAWFGAICMAAVIGGLTSGADWGTQELLAGTNNDNRSEAEKDVAKLFESVGDLQIKLRSELPAGDETAELRAFLAAIGNVGSPLGEYRARRRLRTPSGTKLVIADRSATASDGMRPTPKQWGNGGLGGGGGLPPEGRCLEAMVKPPPLPTLIERGERYVKSRGRWHDAEDVARDTALAVCEKKPEKRGEDLRRYYFGALKRNIKHLARKHNTRNRCDIREMIRQRSESKDVWPEVDATLDVRSHLCLLDASDRSVIELHLKGIDGKTAALRLGISPSAYRKRLSRAHDRLAASMKLNSGM